MKAVKASVRERKYATKLISRLQSLNARVTLHQVERNRIPSFLANSISDIRSWMRSIGHVEECSAEESEEWTVLRFQSRKVDRVDVFPKCSSAGTGFELADDWSLRTPGPIICWPHDCPGFIVSISGLNSSLEQYVVFALSTTHELSDALRSNTPRWLSRQPLRGGVVSRDDLRAIHEFTHRRLPRLQPIALTL
jgi:hypothetical protein